MSASSAGVTKLELVGVIHPDPLLERALRLRRRVHSLNVPNGERTARFIEPMPLLRTDKLPGGDGRRYEVLIKFDASRGDGDHES